MKLYYAMGTCSLAPHIALHEIEAEFEIEKVDIKGDHKTESGRDFYTINPKGYVPALEMGDGEVLAEGVAIQLYIASLRPDLNLAVSPDRPDYYRFIAWLAYINTEFHKGGFLFFFTPMGVDATPYARKRLHFNLDYVEKHLAGREFAFNAHFTLVDIYLYTVLSWSKKAGIDLAAWPAVTDYFKRIGTRPSIQKALKAEGLR